MDHLIQIVVLSVCATSVRAYQPFGVVLQSRGGRPLLQDLMDEYEPYAIAALPMPSPMPSPIPSPLQLFQLVSPPAPRKYKPRKPARHPEREYVLAASSHEETYEPAEYSESASKPKYSVLEEEDAPVYVYARPNKYGGYSYRRPAAPAPAHPPAPAAHREPFVIRIHRYRINRDR